MAEWDFAIIGLGNPGRNYQTTRHNVGFMFADHIAQRIGERFQPSKWEADLVRCSLAGKRGLLVKPQTFMNLSGRAVAAVSRFFHVSPGGLIVVHDDIDMGLGRIKLLSGGGSGGHNGIKSIVQHLGTSDFFRLKIGIGRPGAGRTHAEMPVEAYVLSAFSPTERDLIRQRFDEVDAGLRLLIEGDTAGAQTQLNSLRGVLPVSG